LRLPTKTPLQGQSKRSFAVVAHGFSPILPLPLLLLHYHHYMIKKIRPENNKSKTLSAVCLRTSSLPLCLSASLCASVFLPPYLSSSSSSSSSSSLPSSLSHSSCHSNESSVKTKSKGPCHAPFHGHDGPRRACSRLSLTSHIFCTNCNS
jgi:hypothetical protein